MNYILMMQCRCERNRGLDHDRTYVQQVDGVKNVTVHCERCPCQGRGNILKEITGGFFMSWWKKSIFMFWATIQSVSISSCRGRTASHNKAQGRQRIHRVHRGNLAVVFEGSMAWGTACSWHPPSPCQSWCTPRPSWRGWRRWGRDQHRSMQQSRTSHTWTRCSPSEPGINFD